MRGNRGLWSGLVAYSSLALKSSPGAPQVGHSSGGCIPSNASLQTVQTIVTVIGGWGTSPSVGFYGLAGVFGEVGYGDFAGYDVLHRGAGAAQGVLD